MKKVLLPVFILSVFYACDSNKSSSQKVENHTVSSKQFDKAIIYSTAKDSTLDFSKSITAEFKEIEQPVEGKVYVFVNPNKVFQTLLGIGGAITDASAEVFSALPPENQEKLLEAYFDKEKGIGYSIIRTSIHSSDFGSESFSYIEEGDSALKTFTIAHDKEFRIPFIKKAIEKAKNEMTLFASPWTPPAFMKSNGEMLHGGKLLPQFAASWALYYTKFIKAYEQEGIPVWGITVQNEPMAIQRWESCIYTAAEERDFLKNHLGPTMAKEGFGDKKIIVWDHNRDLINQRADVIFEDPEAAKYAWGMGFHWYETWAGGEPMFDNVRKVKESFPDKNLLFTEGCAERFDSTKYFYWPNAERYGKSIINDFNNGTVGWTDWNILLNESGGPNHQNNLCFSPVHANSKTGELIFTPSFFYLGHFSKFIRPGDKRIATSSSRSQLLSTSFINKKGQISTIVMNTSDSSVRYQIVSGSRGLELEIPPHAIQTIVY